MKEKAKMAAMLTADLSNRIDELDGHINIYGIGSDFDECEGKGKTQLHNDIVFIRRLLLQVDKEIMSF